MSRLRLLALILVMSASLPALAQENAGAPSKPGVGLDGKAPQQEPSSGAPSKPEVGLDGKASQDRLAAEHRFWDKTNVLLFAGVTGARFFDYGSTIWMRHRGVHEWLLTDEIVDNHAAFAAIEVAGAAASVGISYAFHKTGHHKLERAVSIVHIGVATGGAIRNFTLP